MSLSTAGRIALLLAVASLLVVGSGGFTSASVDRQVSVQVVADDRAFVEANVCIRTESDDLYLQVTNRFPDPVEFVAVEERAVRAADRLGPDQSREIYVRSGETETYRLDGMAGIDPGEDVLVTIRSEGVQVSLTRTAVNHSKCGFHGANGGGPKTSTGAGK